MAEALVIVPGYTVSPPPLVRWVPRKEYGRANGMAVDVVLVREVLILQMGRLVIQSNDPAHPVGSVEWEDVPTVEEGAAP
jgi:hypothetical protein